jgi:nicotinamidase-related amidase
MPLTQLDPVTAFVAIDLQRGVVGLPTVHPAAEIVARAAQLAHAFRARKLPVVLVNVTGTAPGRTDLGPRQLPSAPDWAELMPELGREPSDILVTKRRVGAFLGTSLDHQLRTRGVTQIVLAGISTSSGVEATARSAHDLGYHVTFAVDAMTDLDAAMHRHAVERIFPKLGETGTTEGVLGMLGK